MGILACLVFSALLGYWALLPTLRVYVDPDLAFEVDWVAFRDTFVAAGVDKVELVVLERSEDVAARPLGPSGRVLSVGLVSRRGRNPYLDAEALEAGKTGPGHTEGRLAVVHPDEIMRFLWKHRRRYPGKPSPDWISVRGHLFTNTAVHEAWHAVANSHSHNPVDRDSVMFWDPGAAALEFGTRALPFTRGHRQRLQELFAPVRPWGGGLETR